LQQHSNLTNLPRTKDSNAPQRESIYIRDKQHIALEKKIEDQATKLG
jgi:hypothetical protein